MGVVLVVQTVPRRCQKLRSDTPTTEVGVGMRHRRPGKRSGNEAGANRGERSQLAESGDSGRPPDVRKTSSGGFGWSIPKRHRERRPAARRAGEYDGSAYRALDRRRGQAEWGRTSKYRRGKLTRSGQRLEWQ